MFSLSHNKSILISSFEEWVNGSWEWKLVWRRGLFEWEKNQEFQPLQVLQGLNPVSEFNDRWIWKDDKIFGYLVKFVYKILKGSSERSICPSLISCGRLKICPKHNLLFGGCWLIRLFLRIIWKDEGLLLVVVTFVVFAKWKWSQLDIFFLNVDLLGWFRTCATLGWGWCRLIFMILSHTYYILSC